MIGRELRSLGYLKSLQNRERFGATPRFWSAHLSVNPSKLIIGNVAFGAALEYWCQQISRILAWPIVFVGPIFTIFEASQDVSGAHECVECPMVMVSIFSWLGWMSSCGQQVWKLLVSRAKIIHFEPLRANKHLGGARLGCKKITQKDTDNPFQKALNWIQEVFGC